MKLLYPLCMLFLLSCKQKTEQVVVPSQETEIDESKEDAEALAALYMNYKSNPADQSEKDENAIIEFFAERYPDAVRTQSGVYYKILKQGDKNYFKTGDVVEVYYKGYFEDGIIFDSNMSGEVASRFEIGKMIPGWNELLLNMSRGAEFVAGIPSHLAYGSQGISGKVPPNSVLFFNISTP